jgi:hypothetical protein
MNIPQSPPLTIAAGLLTGTSCRGSLISARTSVSERHTQSSV